MPKYSKHTTLNETKVQEHLQSIIYTTLLCMQRGTEGSCFRGPVAKKRKVGQILGLEVGNISSDV
jgi:hypothetical protein